MAASEQKQISFYIPRSDSSASSALPPSTVPQGGPRGTNSKDGGWPSETRCRDPQDAGCFYLPIGQRTWLLPS